MAGKVFVDSNIWIYLFLSEQTNKYSIAEEFITKNTDSSMFISYQVINEVTNQLLRNNFSEIIIRKNVEYMYKICTIHNFSKEILLSASSLREKYRFSFWDSVIVASALNSGCDILATEDMQNGQKIDGMIITNIFAPTSLPPSP